MIGLVLFLVLCFGLIGYAIGGWVGAVGAGLIGAMMILSDD